VIFSKPNVTGIVLAGGQSRRMGYNKAEAMMHGRSMLLLMIDKLSSITPTILVSSGELTYRDIKYRQIPDVYPDCGPLGGIYSVLKASTTSLNLVVACDLPLVKAQFLAWIIEKAASNNALITVPVNEKGQPEMLCAVYHKDILPIMEQQIKLKAFKLKNLIDLVPSATIKISIDHPLYNEHAFKNVNSPEVLNEARELWKNP
jgi:molybdopterin-guanine dinucleotide biosynthesis protein A